MSGELVARFSTVGEAEGARSALHAAGMDAYLVDNWIVALNWLYSNAVGGIKLIVCEDDAEEALLVLAGPSLEPASIGGGLIDEPAALVATDDPLPAIDGDMPAGCPECASVEVARVPRLKLFLVFGVLVFGIAYAVNEPDFGLAAIFVTALIVALVPSCRCKACGNTWNAAEPANVVASEPPAPDASETIDTLCPRCGSPDFYAIDYRRIKAIPLFLPLVAVAVVPLWLVLPKRRCERCNWRT